MLTTSAMRGPRRHRRSNSSTAAMSPATSASTEPSSRLRTQPDSPSSLRLLHHPVAKADALHAAADHQALGVHAAAHRSRQAQEPLGQLDLGGDRRGGAPRLPRPRPKLRPGTARRVRPTRGPCAASSCPSASARPSTRLPSAGTATPSAASAGTSNAATAARSAATAAAMLLDVGDAGADPQRRVVRLRDPVEPWLPARASAARPAHAAPRRGSTAGRSRRSGRSHRPSARDRERCAAARCPRAGSAACRRTTSRRPFRRRPPAIPRRSLAPAVRACDPQHAAARAGASACRPARSCSPRPTAATVAYPRNASREQPLQQIAGVGQFLLCVPAGPAVRTVPPPPPACAAVLPRRAPLPGPRRSPPPLTARHLPAAQHAGRRCPAAAQAPCPPPIRRCRRRRRVTSDAAARGRSEPVTRSGTTTGVADDPPCGRRRRSSVSVPRLMVPLPSMRDQRRTQHQRLHRADAVSRIEPGGEALDLAGTAAADQVQRVHVAQDRTERAAQQPVVHRRLRHRDAERSVQAGGNGVRRRAGAAEIGVNFHIAVDVDRLADGRRTTGRNASAGAFSRSVTGGAGALASAVNAPLRLTRRQLGRQPDPVLSLPPCRSSVGRRSHL